MSKTIFLNAKINPDTKMIEPANEVDRIKLDFYMKKMKKFSNYEIMISLNSEEKNYPQLQRVHGCIRQVSVATGISFDKLKKQVKRVANLYDFSTDELKMKSFRVCTVEELDKAIQAIEDIAEAADVVLTEYAK